MVRFLPLLLLAACTPSDDDTGGDTAVEAGCRAGAPRVDATRYAVVSHPYGAAGRASNAWEVLAFGPDGTWSVLDQSFEMGRGNLGPVAFTPDGSLGMAVQDDGTLGVFTLDEAGVPTVVEAGWSADDALYASQVVFAPSGERAWVLDGNWPDNGGGIFEVAIDCTTGAPSLVGRVASSKLASHLFLHDDGTWTLIADGVLDSEAGEAWRLDPAGPSILGSAPLFDYDDAITGGAAMTGEWLLVGDNSAFSGVDNRVAIARRSGDGIEAIQAIAPLEDPIAIAAHGDTALVASGFGDALYVLHRDPSDAATPWSSQGELTYEGAAPQLPAAVVAIDAPDGSAWMLTAELSGVRTTISDGTTVVDRGLFDLGAGQDRIVGTLGIQP